MHRVVFVIEIWIALNLAVAALITYQRSAHLRHQLFRWTLGNLTPPRQREFAHVLVDAARHHH
jgi:hypothetical protein